MYIIRRICRSGRSWSELEQMKGLISHVSGQTQILVTHDINYVPQPVCCWIVRIKVSRTRTHYSSRETIKDFVVISYILRLYNKWVFCYCFWFGLSDARHGWQNYILLCTPPKTSFAKGELIFSIPNAAPIYEHYNRALRHFPAYEYDSLVIIRFTLQCIISRRVIIIILHLRWFM